MIPGSAPTYMQEMGSSEMRMVTKRASANYRQLIENLYMQCELLTQPRASLFVRKSQIE